MKYFAINKSLNQSGITVYITGVILKYLHKVELSAYIALQNYLALLYSSFHNSTSCWFSNIFYILSISNCKWKIYAFFYHKNNNKKKQLH